MNDTYSLHRGRSSQWPPHHLQTGRNRKTSVTEIKYMDYLGICGFMRSIKVFESYLSGSNRRLWPQLASGSWQADLPLSSRCKHFPRPSSAATDRRRSLTLFIQSHSCSHRCFLPRPRRCWWIPGPRRPASPSGRSSAADTGGQKSPEDKQHSVWRQNVWWLTRFRELLSRMKPDSSLMLTITMLVSSRLPWYLWATNTPKWYIW